MGSSTPYYGFWPRPGQARGVQIDLNADRIGMRCPVEAGLVGHAEKVLQALLPHLEHKDDRASAAMARNLLEEHRVAMSPALQQHQDELPRHL